MEKLTKYQDMIKRCTIRAPHDGFLVHGNRPGRTLEVYEGASVRQGQKLFDLPDLSKMEIVALLHETIVNRIKPGMPVRVRIEALPEAGEMYGRVSKVDSMPYNERKREGANNGNAAASEITYFLGHMELDKTIPGLKPGMSAKIEILAERGPGVLAVPIEAVVREDDVDVCYVTHLDPNLPHEHRVVTAGRSSHEVVEIVNGLKEGETVVLRAPKSHTTVAKRHLNGFGGTWDLSKFPPPTGLDARKGGRGGFGGGFGGFGGGGGGFGVVVAVIGHVVRAKARDVAVKAVAVAAAVILQLCHRTFDAPGAPRRVIDASVPQDHRGPGQHENDPDFEETPRKLGGIPLEPDGVHQGNGEPRENPRHEVRD